jgi:glycerophosphoryl diester phosphodiesterase
MSESPLVVGHRGWPARYPDNTLAGFIAVTAHADVVELDVRRCADGKLVVAHDPSIRGMEVAGQPWSILGELDVGEGHHPALLDEVMGSIRPTPTQIEVKNVPWQPGYEPDHRLALEAADRAGPLDMVTSFNWETVRSVRRVFPEVLTGIALDSHIDLHDVVAHSLEAGHRVLVPEETLMTEEAAELIGSSGLQCFPWTVNDLSRAIELAELGVAGIITDDAESLAALRS